MLTEEDEKMTQVRVKDLFAPELQQGIRVFGGGQDVYELASLSPDETEAISYCFDTNMRKIENVSPKLAACYRPQKTAMMKWAQVAKGIFPQCKNYSYPAMPGGLGVDFLTPYLFGYGNSQTGTGAREYFDTAGALNTGVLMGDWRLTHVAGTVSRLLGNTTGALVAYHGCATVGSKSFVVLFQDGILEVGTTPKISELYFKSDYLDMYTPISVPPLVSQSIEEGKQIYQYNTPGMIPISHVNGMSIYAAPIASGDACMPLMGMCFYEQAFNISTMVAH